MEKLLRCTVCTWRGSWVDALLAPPLEPIDLAKCDMQIQSVYEERQSERIRLGAPERPGCPRCGHHTQPVRRPSIRPAM